MRLNGVEVLECQLRPGYKFWLRYPLLLSQYMGSYAKHDIFFVPEFCQKDVPLAQILSLLTSKKVVFDPLSPRHETKITDWKRKPPDSWQARWNFKIDYWSFKLSDRILADTQAHKDYYRQRYNLPSGKIEVLPVGYNDDLYKPSGIAKKGNGFTVLFFGSFLPLHGVDVIIQSAKIVSGKDPSVQFTIIGSGQIMPLAETLASELGLNNLRFEGWMPQNMLPKKIASSDVCLGIFGKTEKARRVVPHKIFQSLGMKKPLITTRTPAVEEFFSHRENIFLIPEPHPELLAQAILELKEDLYLRERIAERGYQLVSRNFCPEAVGRALIRVLEK